MFGNILNIIGGKEAALAMVRHALTAGAAALVTAGLVDDGTANMLVGGGALLFSFGWALVEAVFKRRMKSAVRELDAKNVQPITAATQAVVTKVNGRLDGEKH